MIKLFDYWRSSASYRVRIALGLAGEHWDSVVIDLLQADHRSDAHLARNPQGLVPVLEIDGHSFTQSLAQIEYLNETRALSLLPNHPAGRAQVRALAYAIAMEIHPVCNLGVARFAVEQSQGNITNEVWMKHFIQNGLAAYEGMVIGTAFSYGESVTLADVCLMPQIYNAQRWGVDLDQFPKISTIKASLDTTPAFIAAYPKNHAA
tara:strand:- start:161 stop:778 length:618 start_codon:yes stop_codon:yes gene_type:complete